MRVTERAAVAAARFRGRGDERAADQAAVDAMRRELNQLADRRHGGDRRGRTRRSADALHRRGGRQPATGPKVDIALDPLEGTTICAKNLPNALAVIAIAEKGGLLNAPDVYMEKIAIGPGYPKGIVDLDASPAENIHALAKAKGVDVGDITACVLDRPRHARIIEELRATGAAIRLIGDGDVAGMIHTTEPEMTGIDIYLGIGGAPEGVLAAAALRCIGGQMQGRLDPRFGASSASAPAGWAHRHQPQVRHERHGPGRRALRRHRRDRRQPPRRRPLRQAGDRHPHGGDALVIGHGALDQGRAPGPREVRRPL